MSTPTFRISPALVSAAGTDDHSNSGRCVRCMNIVTTYSASAAAATAANTNQLVRLQTGRKVSSITTGRGAGRVHCHAAPFMTFIPKPTMTLN